MRRLIAVADIHGFGVTRTRQKFESADCDDDGYLDQAERRAQRRAR